MNRGVIHGSTSFMCFGIGGGYKPRIFVINSIVEDNEAEVPST